MTRDWRRIIGVSGRLLQVWFEQRLPDLQARSWTISLWTVATGLVCTEASWPPGEIGNYGSLDGWYRFGLYRGFLTSRHIRTVATGLVSFFSDFFRSQVEVILRISASQLFAALERRVKYFQYLKGRSRRSSNDEQVQMSSISIFPVTKILQ